MSNPWRLSALCQDVNVNQFIEPTFNVARFYCDRCPVMNQCKALGDETQSVGVFGGLYRETDGTQYIVHRRDGGVLRTEKLDSVDDDEMPADSMTRDEALRSLGVGTDAFRRAAEALGVSPIRSVNGLPLVYSGFDVERFREHFTYRPAPGHITSTEAAEILGLSPRDGWFRDVLKRHGVDYVVPSVGGRPSHYRRDEIERVAAARQNPIPVDCVTAGQAADILGLTWKTSVLTALRKFGVSHAGTVNHLYYFRRSEVEEVRRKRSEVPEGMISTDKAQALLGISGPTFRRWLSKNGIKAAIHGRPNYYRLEEIENLGFVQKH